MVGNQIGRRAYRKRSRSALPTAGILAVLLLQVQAGAAWAETVTLTPPYAESATFTSGCGPFPDACVAEATADHTTGELSFAVAAAPLESGSAVARITGTHTLEGETNAIDYTVNVHITELFTEGSFGASAGLDAEARHSACPQCSGGEGIVWLPPRNAVVGEDVPLAFTLTNGDGGPVPPGTIQVLVRLRGSAGCDVCLGPESSNGRATVTSMEGAWNNNPVAVDDVASSRVGFPVRISVLANDSDRDGDPLSVIGVSDPPNGSAVINADNTVTYDPDGCFLGTDTFTYTMSDGNGGTDTATVSVRLRKTSRRTSIGC